MKIALIGATGYVGSKILTEALNRGHDVTAIVQHPEKLPQHPKLTAKAGSVFDQAALTELLKGHEAVISAFNPGHANPNLYRDTLEGAPKIFRAVEAADVPRLLVVGGAASLEVAPGKKLFDTPDFPATYKEVARATGDVLELLKKEASLNWTFLSPSALLVPGQRTGKFRLGDDQLLVDAEGKSHISVEDYAVAMIDELEKPAHKRQRFTVGY